MTKPKTIVQAHTTNFKTLQRAFREGAACIMECQNKATGELEAVICAAWRDEEGMINFTPFAAFVNGNPYEKWEPPNPDGGFFEGDKP